VRVFVPPPHATLQPENPDQLPKHDSGQVAVQNCTSLSGADGVRQLLVLPRERERVPTPHEPPHEDHVLHGV